MSSRVGETAAPRERRTHAERTAETRERVMAAVVESIAEVGYQKTTAAEIARRAEVTWGAVQHHFGDKEGILRAVLESSFERFEDILGDLKANELPVEGRVTLFVDRSWEHFSSPHYRSMFEILLNLPDDMELSWQREMLDSWTSVWARYFPESHLEEKQTFELMHYTISVLSGLATMAMLGGSALGSNRSELRLLKDTLARELGGAS